MSDYRYDPLQQTMSYGGYESYGAMNSVRVGLENRPNSIGLNSLSQNRMLGNRIPSMHDYYRGSHYDQNSYMNDYNGLMNKTPEFSPLNMQSTIGMNKSMPLLSSSRTMHGYPQMMSLRAPGMDVGDIPDPSNKTSFSSNEPSTSTTPRFLTPMQQTNQESKPQLRSNVVFYTDEDLGYSSESPDYCFKIPPVLAHSLMSEEWNNHCLPDRYMIRRPPLTVAQMKTFSTNLLLCIFYTQTRDCLQLVAAQELYSRDYVYHKVKKTWYKREKGITNYAYITVKEEFSTSLWSFRSSICG